MPRTVVVDGKTSTPVASPAPDGLGVATDVVWVGTQSGGVKWVRVRDLIAWAARAAGDSLTDFDDLAGTAGLVALDPATGLPSLVDPGSLPGASGSQPWEVGETPAGLVNGSNATFTTAREFDPLTVSVYVNGLQQRRVTDFNTSGTTTITLTDSPQTGDSLRVTYQRG